MRTCLQDTMTCQQYIDWVIELTTAGLCISSTVNQYNIAMSSNDVILKLLDNINVVKMYLCLTVAIVSSFTGSPSAILSRKSIEFCIIGSENLPRTLLMYLSNTLLSQHVYFPTVLCNSRPFNKTVINHSLKYTAFDSKHEPRPLNSTDFKDLIKSGAAFASPFLTNDPVLDRIDQEILGRSPGNPLPGGWCLGDSGSDKCTVWGDADVLRPSKGARRLEKRIVKLLTNGTFRSHQCIVVK